MISINREFHFSKLPQDLVAHEILEHLTEKEIGEFATVSHECNELVAYRVSRKIKSISRGIYSLPKRPGWPLSRRVYLLKRRLKRDWEIASCFYFYRISKHLPTIQFVPNTPLYAKHFERIVTLVKNPWFWGPTLCRGHGVCRDKCLQQLMYPGVVAAISLVLGPLGASVGACYAGWGPVSLAVGGVIGSSLPPMYALICGADRAEYSRSLKRFWKIIQSDIPRRPIEW